MKTFAPELSALIIILRSAGPVISTRRSCRSARRRRDAPVAVADVRGLGQEVGQLAGVEAVLPGAGRVGEQLLAAVAEVAAAACATNASASAVRILVALAADLDAGQGRLPWLWVRLRWLSRAT